MYVVLIIKEKFPVNNLKSYFDFEDFGFEFPPFDVEFLEIVAVGNDENVVTVATNAERARIERKVLRNQRPPRAYFPNLNRRSRCCNEKLSIFGLPHGFH